MINKQRVRRIKNLIYAFIIVILLMPVILMIALSLKVLNTNREILHRLTDQDVAPYSAQSDQSEESSEAPESASSPDDGVVLPDPQQSAANNESRAGGDTLDDLAANPAVNPDNAVDHSDMTAPTSGIGDISMEIHTAEGQPSEGDPSQNPVMPENMVGNPKMGR